jgi:hypothetical protein
VFILYTYHVFGLHLSVILIGIELFIKTNNFE